MCLDVGRQAVRDDPLLIGELLSRAVSVVHESKVQILAHGGVLVCPLKVVVGYGDLGAAGGHDSPAEPLFGGEGGKPTQVHPQQSDGLSE